MNLYLSASIQNHNHLVFTSKRLKILVSPVRSRPKANRLETARSYKEVASVLKKYCNNKDLPFVRITYDFLRKFETHHFSKGNSPNSLAAYMRTIRDIYNKAIKVGLAKKNIIPLMIINLRPYPLKNAH